MKFARKQFEQVIKEVLEEQAHALGGSDNPYEKHSVDETLDDFWMNELNSALLASMASAGVGNSMMPSKFLEALLPVLRAYGVADEAEEMVDHVRSNQDIYSPGRPPDNPAAPEEALQEKREHIKMKITESRLREIVEEEILSEMMSGQSPHVGTHGGLSVQSPVSADRAAHRDDDYHFGFDPEENPPRIEGETERSGDFQSDIMSAANKIEEIASSNPDEMDAVQEIVKFVQNAFATMSGPDNYMIRMALDVAAEQNSEHAMLFLAIKEEFPQPDWAKKLD